MAREAKLAAVFIGILLTVFCALLIKRLARPTSLPLANLPAQPLEKTAESGTSSRIAPTQPIVVTPRSGSDKPPELAMDGDHNRQSSDGSFSWSSAKPPKIEVGAPIPLAENKSSPLVATPKPINDLAESKTPVARDSVDSPPRVIGAPLSTTTENASSPSSPINYRSAYGEAGSSSPQTPVAANSTLQSAPDPFRQSTTPEPPRYDYRNSMAKNETVGSAPAGVTNPSAATSRSSSAIIPGESSANSYGGASMPSSSRYLAPLQQASPAVWPSETVSNASSGAFSAGSVVPASAPIQRDGEQYTVQPNDSYWTISQKVYGSGAYFKALYEHNRKRSPSADELKVGDVLIVPDEGILRRTYPDLCPKPRKPLAAAGQSMVSTAARMRGAGRVYTVVDGDTLFEIARHELGKPARWGEIYQLNREVLGDDFDYLKPGLELVLPQTAGSDRGGNNSASRPAESMYSR